MGCSGVCGLSDESLRDLEVKSDEGGIGWERKRREKKREDGVYIAGERVSYDHIVIIACMLLVQHG